jgi:hypothetical protein
MNTKCEFFNVTLNSKASYQATNLLLFLILFLFSSRIEAQFEELPSLVQNSSLVIKGKVISQKGAWTSDNSTIRTVHTILVEKLYKGTLTDTIIKVCTEGGFVDGDGVIVSHGRTMKLENNYFIFVPTEKDSDYKHPEVAGSKYNFHHYELEQSGVNEFYRTNNEVFLSQQIESLILLSTKQSIGIRENGFSPSNIECDLQDNLKIISFNFDNVFLTGNNQFIEFDVMAKVNTPGLRFGKGTVYIKYPISLFGGQVFSEGSLEITKSTILNSNIYSLSASDKNDSVFQVKIDVSQSGLGSHYVMTNTFEKLFHGKIKIENLIAIQELLNFSELNITSDLEYFCLGNYTPFDKVEIGDPVTGINSENPTTIFYTMGNPTTLNNGKDFSIDLFVASTSATNFLAGRIFINYNTAAFGSNVAVNSKVKFNRTAAFANFSGLPIQVAGNPSQFQLIVASNINTTVSINSTATKIGTLVFKDIICPGMSGLSYDQGAMTSQPANHQHLENNIKTNYDFVNTSSSSNTSVCNCGKKPDSISFSPARIAAGTGEILTIKGKNFGIFDPAKSRITFLDADQKNNMRMNAADPDLLFNANFLWSDTLIKIRVPSTDRDDLSGQKSARTGPVGVVNDCGEGFSKDSLKIIHSYMTIREGSNTEAYKLVRGTLNSDRVKFQFTKRVPMNYRRYFKKALENWCAETKINVELLSRDTNLVLKRDSISLVDYIPNNTNKIAITENRANNCLFFDKYWSVLETDILINSNFTLDSNSVIQALTHELGHAHLLSHSKSIDQDEYLMYFEIQPNTKITLDDKTGAERVFGYSKGAYLNNNCAKPIGKGFCGISTSISEGFEDISFFAYVSGNSIFINNSNPNVDYSLVNTYGQMVKAWPSNFYSVLPLPSISSGVYILIGQSKEKIYIQKLLIAGE